mmetsp:Transcript_69390/g.224374  ORF Transcript_69390/g.224374 Transcript_69390/m.224374 type:complete len:131 (-) Transcript_69390:578-970(-)
MHAKGHTPHGAPIGPQKGVAGHTIPSGTPAGVATGWAPIAGAPAWLATNERKQREVPELTELPVPGVAQTGEYIGGGIPAAVGVCMKLMEYAGGQNRGGEEACTSDFTSMTVPCGRAGACSRGASGGGER